MKKTTVYYHERHEDREDIYKDMFEEHEAILAARGCNQNKHKPGCPKADGGFGAEGKKDIKALQKDFETADQKVRDTITRIYKLQQEKEKIPNKTFSETVDKSNAIKQKQIDLEIKALQKERDEAIEERDRIARALREQLTEPQNGNVTRLKNMTTKQKYELFRGAWASAVDKNTGKTSRLQITALQADAVARWGVVGVDDGRIWVMNGGKKYFLEDRTLADIAE